MTKLSNPTNDLLSDFLDAQYELACERYAGDLQTGVITKEDLRTLSDSATRKAYSELFNTQPTYEQIKQAHSDILSGHGQFGEALKIVSAYKLKGTTPGRQ